MRTSKQPASNAAHSPAPAGRSARQARDAEAVYHLQAEICRTLGHFRRIQVVDLLSSGEKTASELRAVLKIGKVNLSQHLSLLKQAGLIQSRPRGRETLYRLVIPEVTDACQMIRRVLRARLQEGSRLVKALQFAKAENEVHRDIEDL